MTPAEKKEWAARRRDYVVGGPCMRCGHVAHDVHEIRGGSSRDAMFIEPAGWMRLCRLCHQQLQGEPMEFQLALKLLQDAEHFDLDAFCKAWGRPITAVCQGAIVECVRLILITPYFRRLT